MKIILAMLVLLWSLALVGCSGEGDKSGEGDDGRAEQTTSEPAYNPAIYAVNYPLAYFAGRIAGSRARVEFSVPPDVDPAFWRPELEAVAAFQDADLILLNGATYAKWTSSVSLPSSRAVNTSAGFADRYIVVADAATHSHGPGGEHAHTGTAFTTWLDLGQAVEQARAIRDALNERWPTQSARWNEGFSALEKDLRSLDADLQNTVAGKQSLALVASHPVYQYLARRYSLNIASVMWEPGEFPSERQWRDFAALVNETGAAWMVWEGEPLPATRERLEEIGVNSVVFDPCGNTPDEGDFLTVMSANIERINSVFQQK
jgi:zinc transport system substrate-binding protein